MSIAKKLKEQIKDSIVNALDKAREEGMIQFSELPDFILEVPRDKTHGDFATNIAMLLTKQAKQPPRKIAEVLVDYFSFVFVDKIEVAGPGFINFYLNPAWLDDVIPEVIAQDEKYGHSNVGQGKKVQVEFVSANPTGLLHMGNARGGALGDSIASLLEAVGYDVTREFYINDAGNQILNFAKSLEARYFQLFGVDLPFPEDGYHGEDVIDTTKNIIEKVGDKYLSIEENLRRELLVKSALEEKISAIKKALEGFGIKYDIWFSEQSLHDSGAITETLNLLKEKDLIYEHEGALWFKATLLGDEKDEVVVRGNGTPTYFAADIAYHKNKFDRGFDRVINIWGADHHGHVARLKGSMAAIGYDSEKLDIILMQLVRLFRDGEIVRMSKRSGQYVTLTELVEEVGKDSARYFFVMRNPDSHLDFDLNLAKEESSENPVFYVQYAHARICSILKASGTRVILDNAPLNILREPAETELLRKIADLPEELVSAAEKCEPYRIARYALDLASLFHTFYNNCRVLADDEKLKMARLALVDATRITLRNVLNLLGVSAPERM